MSELVEPLPPLEQVATWLKDYETFWSGGFDRLDAHLRKHRKDSE